MSQPSPSHSASLARRFMVPASLVSVVVVLVTALVFSNQMASELENAADREMELTETLIRIELDAIDGLRSEMVTAGLSTLRSQAARLGTATLEGRVPFAAREGVSSVPDLHIGGVSQSEQYRLVDEVKGLVGGTATLFVKDGDEFVRVSTNVQKDDGSRAIGTVLNPEGKAYAAITQGQPYYGIVDILGHPYLTGYEPMTGPGGETIGIWYVGYRLSEMDEVLDFLQVRSCPGRLGGCAWRRCAA